MYRLKHDQLQNLADTKKSVEATVTELETILRKMELPYAARQVKRMQDGLTHVSNHADLEVQFRELRNRIDDEIAERAFFEMPPNRVQYYKCAHLFGEDVDKAFPSGILDIEESGKCYAMSRNTACIFHLMRVMEVGLRSLGKSLNNPNLDPKRNPSWESILKKCDEELQKPLNERSPEWRIDDRFFSEATANLRAVKDAWRNPTMHVDAQYDDEKVIDVWNSVRAFMRHLALRLTE